MPHAQLLITRRQLARHTVPFRKLLSKQLVARDAECAVLYHRPDSLVKCYCAGCQAANGQPFKSVTRLSFLHGMPRSGSYSILPCNGVHECRA